MARIAGVELPPNKKVEYALPYLYGIGSAQSRRIISEAKVDPNIRVKDLSEAEVTRLRETLERLRLPVEGEARRIVTQNIKRLQEIGSYRGTRHKKNLPVRGQRTRSNARTRRGKKKTIGGMKRTLQKT
ncbi:MAG: 30S ribosomal protein S13 [bacterium]|nr:30S ribosomal protein S13 [bacterium]